MKLDNLFTFGANGKTITQTSPFKVNFRRSNSMYLYSPAVSKYVAIEIDRTTALLMFTTQFSRERGTCSKIDID